MATGTIFLATNVIAATIGKQHEVASNLILTVGIILAWIWLAAVSAHVYSSLSTDPQRDSGRFVPRPRKELK